MSLSLLQPPLITLTTDFGLSDTYVGVMKGVILSISPQARLVDLTHEIAPQNVLEASVRLEAAVDYFPVGTVHLIVVDPGVGSARAACVVETERALYVAPDNGALTLPLRRQQVARVIHLTEAAHAYCLQPISHTFHGRDVFAPIAAHLANGLPPDVLGCTAPQVKSTQTSIEATGLITLTVPEPLAEHGPDGWPRLRLHILYSDRFGNLITDLTPTRWTTWLQEISGSDRAGSETRVRVRAGGREWQGISRTFTDVPAGSPLAYWGSGGRLEIGIRDGSAARTLQLIAGDELYLI